MLESLSSSSRSTDHPLTELVRPSTLLRVGAGLVLLARHAWHAVGDAYAFIWKEVPWDWVPLFAEENVPLPHLSAPLAAILLFSIAGSWILGFLTRFFSVLMILLAVPALLYAEGDYAAFSELSWLYLLIATTLMVSGSGMFSLDRLMQGRTGRRRKTKWYR